MIEGLKLDVPGTDLIDHVARREQYHRDKAKQYRDQPVEMDALMASVPNHGQSGDPRTTLNAHALNHTERAQYFAFAGKYLQANETYRLSQDDLRTLEYIGRGW